jgi:hypothetical protein
MPGGMSAGGYPFWSQPKPKNQDLPWWGKALMVLGLVVLGTSMLAFFMLAPTQAGPPPGAHPYGHHHP